MTAETETDSVQGAMEETPVAVEEATAPQDSFPTASLRAAPPRASKFALSSLEIAESAAVEIPAPVQEPPRTLAEAYARILALNAAPPGADKTLRKAHSVLLERARADYHRLAQTPAPPPINHSDFWRRDVPVSALAYVKALYPATKARKA
jgi:hypothetical protein